MTDIKENTSLLVENREIKFRAWIWYNKNKYNKELEDYRNNLYKEWKRFWNDRFSYNKITLEMFEKEKNINYEDGKYIEYKMDYNPSIDWESNWRWAFADLNAWLSEWNFIQYIWIEDKNWVKIHEDDIVLCDLRWDWKIQKFKIEKMTPQTRHRYWELQRVVDDNLYIEVIGNIYQNPELLEK